MWLTMLMAASAAAGTSGGKTMAADDWTAMKILEVGRDSAAQPYYLRVAAGDLDGDGVADEAVVKLICAGGELKQSFYTVKSPRDAATGQASGKRTHHPVTFVKEWGATTPQLAAIRPTYDVKAAKGARTASSTSSAGWTPISLANADGICAAASEASSATAASSSAASR